MLAGSLVLLALVSAFQAPRRSPSPPPPPAATEEKGPGDYEIGIDDILKINVYGLDDLAQVVIVQPDGTFQFPLIGRVKASGLTSKELERKMALLLSRGFVRNPQVTVLVQEYRSKTVLVMGEVSRPGSYPLSGTQTVMDVLARAGPMTSAASTEILIVRPVGKNEGPLPSEEVQRAALGGADVKAQVIRVNLRDIQSGDLQKNVSLLPHDTVFVPQAPRVFVSGEVRTPGAYPFAPGTTVRQAISLAGGLTPDGAAGRIRVVRTADGKTRESKIKMDDPVLPGDTIVVKAKLF